jgi:MFS family permease
VDPIARRNTTFFYERVRSVPAGVLETAGATFLLLIAVRHFHADPLSKALLAAGGSAGLLSTPLVVQVVARRGYRVARAAAALLLAAAAGFLLGAFGPSLPWFVAGGAAGLMCASAAIPLLTQLYQDNYPTEERGRLFSRTVMLRIAAAALFSEWAGRWLSGHMERYEGLMLIFSGACLLGAFCLGHCPSGPIEDAGGSHPLRAWRYVREDAVFRRTLLSWMLMGFSNLMMLPMRVEYLANPKYGLVLSAALVAVMTGVVPNVARLMMSGVWGRLFDAVNFFTLRIAINTCFAVGILAFFTGDTLAGLMAGAFIYGVANAGGDVAWSLWVTKIAAPERVADYMSVHTFLTGLRGLVAPLAAFYLAAYLPLWVMAAFSAGLIGLASLLLLPEVRLAAARRKAAPLVEEVSE